MKVDDTQLCHLHKIIRIIKNSNEDVITPCKIPMGWLYKLIKDKSCIFKIRFRWI